jgi:hypothetical protein
MNKEKVESYMLGLIVFLITMLNVHAGEWDYIPNTNFSYYGSFTDQEFQENISAAASTGGHMLKDYHSIPKLPKEVSQAMHNKIKSYDLDVGDVFSFSCGYESWIMAPKAIVVFIRITRVKPDGTGRYFFIEGNISEN